MRALLVLLAFGSAAAASVPIQEAKDIGVGLIEGFFSDTPLKQCIQGTEIVIEDLDEALKDFEKRDATDVLKGLRQVVEAFHAFPDALKVCKATEGDVAKITHALQQLGSPMQFAYHVGKNLFVNRHDIFTELDAALENYKAKQYHDFGFQLGLALRKLTISDEERFNEFCAVHGKTYKSQYEREYRLKVFISNHEQIYYQQKSEPGSAKYSYLSPFADIDPDEFATFNGFRYNPNAALDAPLAATLPTNSTPDSWDWRAKGAVNPVKNQAQCGSCWAFATVANIEGAGFVETGKLVSLSEQELVDCDHNGDQGCKGGLPSNAYKDMITNKLGLETESDYPYTAADGQCKASTPKETAFITAWQKISTDEDQIATALVKYGPLAIGINAGPMQFYFGGISKPWKILCNPKALDHGVAIVGYGAETTTKYWVIRNSWGASWGEKGYYRIIRGTGACGLNTMVTTATGIKINSAQDRAVVV